MAAAYSKVRFQDIKFDVGALLWDWFVVEIILLFFSPVYYFPAAINALLKAKMDNN